MASVTITFTDTPSKGISVHHSLDPRPGMPLTPAMAAGLDTYLRACHHYTPHTDPLPGVDIDAVHRTRDHVVKAAT